MHFERWLAQQGRSPKTARNYSAAISGSLTKWAMEASVTTCPLDMIDDPTQWERVSEQISGLPIFIQRDKKGNGMYASALRRFSSYLQAEGHSDVQPDIEQIEADTNLTRTVVVK